MSSMHKHKKRRTFDKGSGTKYVVISRPAEDLILDDQTHHDTMLVPAREVTKGPGDDDDVEGKRPRLTAIRFGEDVGDECDELWNEEDEEYESEIDQDFIQEMMAPDPNYTYTVYDQIPQRKGRRTGIDRQFDAAMRQFEIDGFLEADDARVQGTVDAEQMNEEGGFVQIGQEMYEVLPSRSARIEQDYEANKKELVDLTKDLLRRQREAEAQQGGEEEDETEKFDVVRVPYKKDRWDCETILSTYSNLYNHPNVIQPANSTSIRKRFKRRNVDDDQQQQQQQEQEDAQPQVVYIPERNPNETPEERKQRRQLVKEAQRSRRSMKKEVGLMYRAEGIRQQIQPTGKGTMSLS